jgi:hypothetical protein
MCPPPLQIIPQLSLLGCPPFSRTILRKIPPQFSSSSLVLYCIAPSIRITELNDDRRPHALSLALSVPRPGKRKRACRNCGGGAGQDASARINPGDQHVACVEGERAISDCGISDGRKGCCNRKCKGCSWAHRPPVSVFPKPRSTSNHSRHRHTSEEASTAHQVKYVSPEFEPYTYGQEL